MQPTIKPRNPVRVAALFRKAGSYRKSNKAQRCAERVGMGRESLKD